MFSFSFTKIFTKKHLSKSSENNTIIIDVTESFVERGTSMKTQVQAWSNCEHHNTCWYC